ncbi:hypothetical protein E3N88_00778 [Mikania micrantha]|uniref:No apical meristem-associated C-terminal domain-containing protein n=1 Tax=Mikania micrantha TaxID=192012 RepID=A0A5N6PZE1_9ASTR|nr:hypothetical protein E3N88_00778 [Mikania micrantha]
MPFKEETNKERHIEANRNGERATMALMEVLLEDQQQLTFDTMVKNTLEAFINVLKDRYSDMMYNLKITSTRITRNDGCDIVVGDYKQFKIIRQYPPDSIPDGMWAQMCDLWDSEAWRKKSRIAKSNRDEEVQMKVERRSRQELEEEMRKERHERLELEQQMKEFMKKFMQRPSSVVDHSDSQPLKLMVQAQMQGFLCSSHGIVPLMHGLC